MILSHVATQVGFVGPRVGLTKPFTKSEGTFGDQSSFLAVEETGGS